jgi:hypothetical protein
MPCIAARAAFKSSWGTAFEGLPAQAVSRRLESTLLANGHSVVPMLASSLARHRDSSGWSASMYTGSGGACRTFIFGAGDRRSRR